MDIYFKGSEERLDYLINECLEDIGTFSKEKEIALIFKDKNILEDYEHLEDLKIYNNEKAYKVKLIELLIMLYSFKTKTRIGSVLRAYRMANDLSIDKVAEESGVPYTTYQKWELGVRNPTAKKLFNVIRYLEIDIEYIDKAFQE
ncbi:MAG: helix-turn-helix transcriptional regulator [Bacteroidales bacterium]|nr:helix-turn-helix transcriptional regulator [Bacteroidales bacterium]